MRATCLVCGAPATCALGIRLRRRNTTAIWAPNLGAYLCDLHAVSGAEIVIGYRATDTGRIAVVTATAEGETVSKLNHPIGGTPDRQEAMF